MKKLPEEDLWNGLQSRLGDYKEDPDDDTWQKISVAIPHTHPSRGLPRNQIIAATLLLLAAFLTFLIYQYGGQSGQNNRTAEVTQNQPAATDQPKLNISNSTRGDKAAGAINQEVDDKAKIISESNSLIHNLTKDTSEIVDNNSYAFSGTMVTPEGTKYVEVKNKTNSDRFGLDSSEGHMDNESPASTNRKRDKVGEGTWSNTTNMSKSGIHPTEHESGDSIGSPVNTPTDYQDKIEELNTITNKSESKTNSKGSDAITGKPEAMEDSISVKTKGVTKESESIQEDTKKLRVTNRHFYFSITPSLAFAKIKPVPSDAVNVVALHSPGIFNKERLGLSIEAGIQQSLSKRMEWWAGLSFYRQSQQLTYEYEIPAVRITADDSGGYSVSPATAIGEFNYRMLNAGLSTGLLYKLKGVKLMHKVGIGVQYQQGILKGRSEMSYTNSNSRYLNYQLSYRIEFPMTDTFYLYLQPSFTHAIMASEKLVEPFSVTPYRAGITLGISFLNLKSKL